MCDIHVQSCLLLLPFKGSSVPFLSCIGFTAAGYMYEDLFISVLPVPSFILSSIPCYFDYWSLIKRLEAGSIL